MENTDDWYEQEIVYVKERAIAEGSIPKYLNEEYGETLDLHHFVSTIVQLHDQILEEPAFAQIYSDDDEQNYIAEKTSFSKEMIALVLWFIECYQMKTDCSEYSGLCPKCGGDKLYLREEEGDLFGCYIECATCGEHLTFDDMYEFEHSSIPMGREPESNLPKEGEITESSYIFKAATGYRKGIWRKIQLSTGATLDDLANAILSAFCFDDDHLYAFYMDEKGRMRNVPAFYSPTCGDTPKTTSVQLKDLHLVNGSKFLFLYDFGAEWKFTITLDKEVAEKISRPLIIQARGEAPDQYW
jgi:hypothetical protein